MTQRILVATDGTALSLRAAAVAIGLAQPLGATLIGCAALPVYPYHGVGEAAPAEATFQAQAAATANQHLDELERLAAAARVPFVRALREGHAADIILQVAEAERCDLIVMASHGRRGMTSLLLGSETQRVLAGSTRPVLVVR